MWRERLARAKNLPRGWIVADKVLISSVIEPATDFKTFTNRELPKAFADEFFSILNSIGRNVEAYNFETYKSPTPEQRRKSKLMMAEATEYAKKIHLDPAIVASRADYTAYCKNPDDPDNPFAKGWRKDVFSDVLNKHI
jgi:ribonuclease D